MEDLEQEYPSREEWKRADNAAQFGLVFGIMLGLLIILIPYALATLA